MARENESVEKANCHLKKHIKAILSLWRKGGSSAALSANERSVVAKALLHVQRGLTGDRTLAGNGYMQDAASLGSYLLYYWPVSYVQNWCALWSVRTSLSLLLQSGKKSVSILDVGSGPAPASLALCDMLTDINPNIHIDASLIDYSEKALTLAKNLCERQLDHVSVKTKECNLEKDFETDSEQYDIIIMSHALNELFNTHSAESKNLFVKKLASHLSEKGLLLVCEPALLQTSRSLICVRDSLIAEGYSVLAPCPKGKTCPVLLENNHTCHAEIPWTAPEPVASLAQDAGLDRRSVKMTYFVFSKEAKSQQQILTVTSDAMLNKSGRVRFLLCDGTKRIAFSAKKDDPKAKEQAFFDLQRYDRISIENPQLRENGALGFDSQTKVNFESLF